jgi:uncharacterized protein (TIGR00369 family)
MPEQSDDVIPGVGFDAQYGLEFLEVTTELARGRVAVRPEVCQPFGVVHGGVYAAMAEALASYGTASAVWEDGSMVLGMSNNTSFLRPASAGHVNGRARPIHSGRTTWVWDVEMTDDEGRRCAVSRVTVAVRPAPDGVQAP